MSTNKSNNGDASVSTELERFESERIISESVVSVARDRYALEIGDADELDFMRRVASVQSKTYKIPKRVKRKKSGISFIEKIKKLFGLLE